MQAIQQEISKTKPPCFRGAGREFRDWLDLFRNYSIGNGFFPALANRVDLNVIDPYTAFQSLSERTDIDGDVLESVVIARWALIEASDEAVFKSIVQNEGRSYVAWLTPIKTYAPNTFVSQQNLLEELVKTVYHRNKDPILFLTGL